MNLERNNEEHRKDNNATYQNSILELKDLEIT
jgi:hypothetical protein